VWVHRFASNEEPEDINIYSGSLLPKRTLNSGVGPVLYIAFHYARRILYVTKERNVQANHVEREPYRPMQHKRNGEKLRISASETCTASSPEMVFRFVR
jgi:hypothetical protein